MADDRPGGWVVTGCDAAAAVDDLSENSDNRIETSPLIKIIAFRCMLDVTRTAKINCPDISLHINRHAIKSGHTDLPFQYKTPYTLALTRHSLQKGAQLQHTQGIQRICQFINICCWTEIENKKCNQLDMQISGYGLIVTLIVLACVSIQPSSEDQQSLSAPVDGRHEEQQTQTDLGT